MRGARSRGPATGPTDGDARAQYPDYLLQAEFKGETRQREDCQLAPRRIEAEWGAQRIVNLMASWHDQLIEILSAMGMRDVRRLRGDVGRSMLDSELREQALEGVAWAAET